MLSKRGQVTIFIIIAIFVFAGILAFFTLRSSSGISKMPVEMQPVYENFLTCLEQDTETGINLLESQAGYIELPEYKEGSQYMPFSSQLNFLGNPIPYWYYVSGNNMEKEQVPSENKMERQLENFISQRFRECEFQSYLDQGFKISIAEPGDIDVSINDNDVEVSLDSEFVIEKGNQIGRAKNHKIRVNSNLGSLYDSAVKVYEEEQERLFLEEYAIDTLRLYAPVDGTEFTCSPLIWSADNVFDELQDAIEVNTLALGTNSFDDYLEIDLPVSQEVNFLNSQNWPSSFEVLPSEGNILQANPVGNQPGLGIIGFCYTAYHFVYNINYPVLVQINQGEETFQFPMAVVVRGNNPRESLGGNTEQIIPELCKYKNTNVHVSVKDTNLNPINAQISYECFGTKCNIDFTESGDLNTDFPQCGNGYVLARAEGYEDARYLFSTVNPGSIEIIMDKVYEKSIFLKLDGQVYEGEAVVSFISPENTRTIYYPDDKVVEMSEGEYDVQVQVFEDVSITLGSSVAEQCVDVPRSNILGVVGLTKEKCFDIEVPEQTFSRALTGGGKTNIYLSESDLKSGRIEISVDSFPSPIDLNQLQANYILFDKKEVDVDLV